MRNNSWSSPEVIKSVFGDASKRAGQLLFWDGKNNYCNEAEGHEICLGTSGCGKSRRHLFGTVRSIISARESAVIVDPKGEILKHTLGFADDGFDIHVIDFHNARTSETYNPLTYVVDMYNSKDPDERAQSKALAREVISTLADDSAVKDDRYWSNATESVLSGMVEFMLAINIPEIKKIHFLINLFSVYGEKATGFISSLMEAYDINDVSILSKIGILTNNSERTAQCLYSTINTAFTSLMTDPNLLNMMDGDDLRITNIKTDKPFLLYIIVPDYNNIYSGITGLLISQLSNYLIREADKSQNGSLPVRVNLIIDEAGNIARSIPNLPHLMSAGRSRNLRITIVLQSLTQLDQIYGSNDASTIKSNADIYIVFRINDWNTMNDIANKCGRRFITDANGHSCWEELISPSDLMALATGQALVMYKGSMKYVVQFPDYTEAFHINDNDILSGVPERFLKEERELSRYDDMLLKLIVEGVYHFDLDKIKPSSKKKTREKLYSFKLLRRVNLMPVEALRLIVSKVAGTSIGTTADIVRVMLDDRSYDYLDMVEDKLELKSTLDRFRRSDNQSSKLTIIN